MQHKCLEEIGIDQLKVYLLVQTGDRGVERGITNQIIILTKFSNIFLIVDELKRMSLESLDGKKKKGGLSGVSFRMGK